MDLLWVGLRVARRRLGLTFTVFVGDGLVQLVPLAGLAVLVAALVLGAGLAAAAPGAADFPALALAALRFLARPEVLVGVGGACVVAGLAAFGLGAFVRAGLLANLRQLLQSQERFSLRAFVRGATQLFDRIAVLSLLEALAPWCGVAFLVPGLVVAFPALLALLGGEPIAWRPLLLLSLAGSGGTLLALTLFAWSRLAMVELALRPELPASRALAESVHVVAGQPGRLLRFAVVVVGLYALVLTAYVLALVLVSGALAGTQFAAFAPLLGLGLLFALIGALLTVGVQLALLLLYLQLRPGGGELLPSGLPEPDRLGETLVRRDVREHMPSPQEIREVYAAVQRRLSPVAPAEPTPDGAPSPVRQAAECEIDPHDVFFIAELLGEPDPAAPSRTREDGSREEAPREDDGAGQPRPPAAGAGDPGGDGAPPL